MSYGTPPPPPPQWGDQPYGSAPVPQKPTNWLPWAIVSTLCCCLPLGIPSIVFAVRSSSKWKVGDLAGARSAADKARLFFILAVVLGVIANVIYVIVLIRNGEFDSSSS